MSLSLIIFVPVEPLFVKFDNDLQEHIIKFKKSTSIKEQKTVLELAIAGEATITH